MVNLMAVSKHKEKFDNRIDVAQRTIDGKNIHFTEKGGIPWEIKAGKKTKTKRKNKKPSNRKKRTRRNNRSAFFLRRKWWASPKRSPHFLRHFNPFFKNIKRILRSTSLSKIPPSIKRIENQSSPSYADQSKLWLCH